VLFNSKSKTVFRIYPNPLVSGVIFVEILNFHNGKNAFISIIDKLGRVISQQKIESSNVSFNVNFLPEGIYTIVYSDNNKHLPQKFIYQL
jgi:hypothetical protein